jgi:hypothetical protein
LRGPGASVLEVYWKGFAADLCGESSVRRLSRIMLRSSVFSGSGGGPGSSTSSVASSCIGLACSGLDRPPASRTAYNETIENDVMSPSEAIIVYRCCASSPYSHSRAVDISGDSSAGITVQCLIVLPGTRRNRPNSFLRSLFNPLTKSIVA